MNANFKDLTGQTFGRLTVLKFLGERKWLCLCKCGNKTQASAPNLKSGSKKSCGCLHKEQLIKRNTVHGLRRHPLYQVWHNMLKRCNNEDDKSFKYYGGRGIKICNSWNNNVSNFVNWGLENGWQPGLEIDRINNDGNYKPKNCRFVTEIVNANNRDGTNKYKAFGEIKTAREWYEDKRCTISDIVSFEVVAGRLCKSEKWSVKKAITTPKLRNRTTRDVT